MGIVLTQTRNPALDDGVWVDFGGSRFLIAHTSSIKFQRELARLQAPFRKQIEKGTMDPEDTRNVVCKALAATILKDWENVKDEQGNELPYSKSVGEIALKTNEELREFVQEFSTELSNFRQSETEEKGKS